MTDAAILLPHHAALLRASAIAPAVAEARGYRSVTARAELARLGFAPSQQLTPSLLIPIHGVSGDLATYQLRPDQPRIGERGPIKYETARGSRAVLDVPPAVRPWLTRLDIPLYITEGARKADAAVSTGLCCIALPGVWSWRGTTEDGGRTALPDWESVALKGAHDRRQVLIVFDSDVMTKRPVYAALARLRAFLASRGASVRVIYLPAGEGGAKTGLDDYLAAGGTPNSLLALACESLRPPPPDDEEPAPPYLVTESGMVWRKPTREGVTLVPLTNFTARITADIAEDDGAEVRRVYQIEGAVKGRPPRSFTVPAATFSGMGWATEHLGAAAVLAPGMGLRDHARAAVQLLSGDVPERQVFTHTGWRQLGETWVYLHAGGAIGPDGPLADVEVTLSGPLAGYTLPHPPSGDARTSAIRTSLAMWDAAPDSIIVPLWAAVFRAALGAADFSLHLAGPTGAGKSELAALAQQHFGAGLDARHLPGNWASTANALEGLAFAAKDALLVIDDFAPGGSQADVQRLHGAADRVLRGQGNSAGRLRMRADATLRPPKPPRGLILSTGEDVPRGQSLRARTLVLELAPDALQWPSLTDLQRAAAAGELAAALAAFLAWLAPRYELLQRELRTVVAALRETAATSTQHRRTPALVAELGAGLQAALLCAQEAGAIDEAEYQARWSRGWAALLAAGAAQAEQQHASEPTSRFLDLLRAAFVSGHAHVVSASGGLPAVADAPRAWGWRELETPDACVWRPMGDQIGWVDGADLWLEPEASYAVAQRMAREGGEPLAVSARTLHKRLHERGLLLSTEQARDKLTVRKMLDRTRRIVLHLSTAPFVLPEPAQPAQPAHWPATSPDPDSPPALNGPLPWAARDELMPEPARETGPTTTAAQSRTGTDGPSGPVGPLSEAREPSSSNRGATVEGVM